MSKSEKQTLIISGVALVAILILLWILMHRGAITNLIRQAAGLPAIELPPPGTVVIPPPGNIIIPPITFPERDLQMIGSCCMDCASSPVQQYVPAYNGPLVSYVYNQGAQSPIIYDYNSYPDLWHDGIDGNAQQAGCVKGVPCFPY